MYPRAPASPLALLLAVLLLAAAAWWGVHLQQPPAARAADAAPELFSAGRALRDVALIARAPHPIGSAEHGRVRDYLLERLRGLGLAPEIQDAPGLSRQYATAGRVENILARLPGTASTGTILLTAHYDSVPTGSGAADDGAGVAALLETLRLLRTGPALKNDVLVLFSDGEELGLLGAEAFTAHPAFAGVALVLNFEARGHQGPAYLFETSTGNAELVRVAAQSGAPIVANSMTYEVYRRLPNNTDFSVYRREGKPGLNFAFIGGLTHYHSAQDNPANLRPDSLQHHGEYMLALARSFGAVDLQAAPAGHDAVYFTAPWGKLAYYTPDFALGLAVLILLLAGLATLRASKQGQTWRRLAQAYLALAGLILLAGLLGHGLWQGLKFLNPPYRWLSNGEGYHTEFLVYAVLLMALALVGRVSQSVGQALGLAALGVFALLGLASAWLLPGASLFLAWPGLAAALAALLPARRWAPLAQALLLAIAPYLALPLLLQLPVALTPGLLGAVGGLAVLYAALLASILGPLWRTYPALSRLLAFAILVLCAAALVFSRFDEDQKQPDHVIYLLDKDQKRAWWLAAGAQSDDWTRQFLGAGPETASLPEMPYAWTKAVLRGPAPLLALPAPELHLVEDRTEGGTRHLRLQLRSPAPIAALVAEGDPNTEKAGPVQALRIAGQDALGGPFRAQFLVGKPPQDWTLDFELPAGAKLKLRLLQQFYGLPDPHEFAHTARDAQRMTTPLRQADSRFTLERMEF